MSLVWHNLPVVEDGAVGVEFSRAAISAAVGKVVPRLQVDAHLLTFVPIEDGRTQVNVHGFGPFGVLSTGE
jgi:hypothetical protein